jgi:hypothetical protein
MSSITMRIAGISALCLCGIAVGSALHLPAMAAQVYQQYLSPDTTCTSSSPCTTTTNNGSGAASANTSLGGTALTGTTKFNSTSKTKFAVGILGTDSSTKGKYDAGVEGTSVSGNGVLGNTKSGAGLSGVATTGTGVMGVATTGTGVSGSSSDVGISGSGNVGVEGNGGVGVEGSGATGIEAIAPVSETNGTALLAYANGTGGIGVSTTGASFGLQATGNTAVQALGGASGTAVEADSTGAALYTGLTDGTNEYTVDSGGNVYATGELNSSGIFSFSAENEVTAETTDSTDLAPAFEAQTYGGPMFNGFNDATSTSVFNVDASGNETITGQITTAGICSSGCVNRGPQQKRVVSYAPRESQPTMEDFGEAQLVNGEAQVALDPSFANVIDRSASYLVFTTPEGDNRGLYVSQRTPSGFIVREAQGGRSTIGFMYRIVAKPFGDHSVRLPMVAFRSPPIPHRLVMPRLKPATRDVH